MKTRILLIDDDPTILDAFSVYLSTVDDFMVTETATSGAEAFQWLETNQCDLVLSDIHMPDTSGVELLKKIRYLSDPPLFVAMTAFDTDETMLECLSLGAVGYVIKGQEPESIIASLRAALNGGIAISQDSLGRIVKRSDVGRHEGQLKAVELTHREKVILSLICEGKTNGEIGEAMHLAEITVRKVISGLFTRFSAKNRVDLAVKYQAMKYFSVN